MPRNECGRSGLAVGASVGKPALILVLVILTVASFGFGGNNSRIRARSLAGLTRHITKGCYGATN